MAWLWFLVALVVLLSAMYLLEKYSSVTKADKRRSLAGDEIIPPNTVIVMDRATVLAATPEEVWPWIVQLGKGRAGWYAPGWLEKLVAWNPRRRGARQIMPELQHIEVNQVHDDWGPGSLQILQILPAQALVYGSIKAKTTEPRPTGTDFLFSWALTLQELDADHTRLHIRLRMRQPKQLLLKPLATLFGGFFDYLTIIALFAGLKERLRRAN